MVNGVKNQDSPPLTNLLITYHQSRFLRPTTFCRPRPPARESFRSSLAKAAGALVKQCGFAAQFFMPQRLSSNILPRLCGGDWLPSSSEKRIHLCKNHSCRKFHPQIDADFHRFGKSKICSPEKSA